jgi:hypothetical protein
MLGWIHGWVQDHYGDLTGADRTVGWLVALAVFALIRLVRWRPVLAAPVTGRTRSLLAFAGICLAAAGALKFTNARMLFDSAGNPRQSYIETPEGAVIVDAPPGGIDAKTGLIRKALTAEKLRAINIARIGEKDGASGDANHYFNPHDGGTKVWFVQGTCETRASEGYDDRGRKLIPATAELVDRCEKLQAEAERQRESAAQKQARKEFVERRKARRHEFQEIGTYTTAGRFTIIDSIKFVFEGCEVLRRETRLKFRIANLGNAESGTVSNAGFEFTLLNSDGSETRARGVRRIQGVVDSTAQERTLLPPGPGESGRIVIEFERDSESGGFAIAINHAVAFANPGGHTVAYRKF